MAQVQQDTHEIDPITQAFIVDRQNFWQRWTSFTLYAVVAVVVLLILLWWFIV